MIGRVTIGWFVKLAFSLFALAHTVISRAPTTSADEFLQAAWTKGQGLPKNSINAIFQTADGYLWRDHSGVLWIGSNRGLTQFRAGRFVNYDSKEGLSHPEAHALAESGDGVWNREGAALRILVAQSYWRTWWFLTLILTAASLSLFFAVHYRVSGLKRARAAQQAFSRQLIASEESERKRIAAELHDSLGQRLIIIKNLALLVLQNRGGISALDGRQRERIEEISTEVSEAVREVKEISYNLRPYRLDRLGLTAALRVMIETAAAASSTHFSAEIDNIDGVFPKAVEINFYRIVQESVNNVLKHSQARQAAVDIKLSGRRLIAVVRDDGNGFTSDSGNLDSRLSGFGLTGVSERAQLLGGKATVQSSPGIGTTVTIEIILGS